MANLAASGLLRAEGQAYRLHPELHNKTSAPAKLTPPDPESVVLNHVRTHGSITRREVVELWDLSENQAAWLLKKLVEQGKLQMVGQGRGTRYKLGNSGRFAPYGCDHSRADCQLPHNDLPLRGITNPTTMPGR